MCMVEAEPALFNPEGQQINGSLRRTVARTLSGISEQNREESSYISEQKSI